MNFEANVRERTKKLANRLTLWTKDFPDPADLATPAVVFVHAEWSGQSAAMMQVLEFELQLQSLIDVQVHIVNADTLDYRSFERCYGRFPSSGGWGESFWLKQGAIQFVHGGSADRGADKLRGICRQFCLTLEEQ